MAAPGESRDIPYHPLRDGEIRVLEVQPGRFGDLLHVNIRHIQLLEGHIGESATFQPSGHHELQVEPAVQRTSGANNRQGHIPTHTEYEALSYAWGSDEKPFQLFADGGVSIPITASLHHALQRLRYQERPRNLWADAVCINQLDMREKAVQVALMGQVYRGAVRVLVWLGEGTGWDEAAFVMLDALVCWQRQTSEIQPFSLGAIKEHPLTERDIGDVILSHRHSCSCCPQVEYAHWEQAYISALNGVVSILERSWFKRLWVYQEVLLAIDVIIQSGTHTAEFDCLDVLVDWANYGYARFSGDARWSRRLLKASVTPESLGRIADIVNGRADRFDMNSATIFLEAISDTWNKGCKEPHDRIYAIRSFTHIQHWPDLTPDYDSNPVEVFRACTVHCLTEEFEAEHHPSVLLAIAPITHASATWAPTVPWPSWVPDFHSLTMRCDFMNAKYKTDGGATFFPRASMRCFGDALPSKPPDIHSLVVAGRTFGHVLQVLPHSQLSTLSGCVIEPLGRMNMNITAFTDHPAFVAWVVRCGNFINRFLDGGGDSRGRRMMEYPLQSRTLIGSHGVFSHREDPPALLNHTVDTRGIDHLKQSLAGKTDGILDITHRLLEILKESTADRWTNTAVIKVMQMLMWENGPLELIDPERCLAAIKMDKEVLIGWVPESARADDEVCIFYGAPFPFVVRRRSGTDAYTLIGDSYFDGLTEGNATGIDIEQQGRVTIG